MKIHHCEVRGGRALLAVACMPFLFPICGAQADRFYLSEDRLIEGILIHEDSKSVSFELDGAGVWTLSRKALYRVERESPGVYWIRVGDRHQDRDRIDQARNAFEEAAKDPKTRKQAEDRLRDLDAPVVEETLVKAIEEDESHRPMEEMVEESEDPIAKAAKPQPATPRDIPVSGIAKERKWVDQVRKCASEQGVDPLLVRAIIEVESRGNPKATSRSGAKGLMQLMPQTASALGVKDPYNPEQNIRGGVKYLGYLMKQFAHVAWPDRMGHVVAAYNAGPQKIKDAGDYRRVPAASRYADKVLAVYEDLKENLSSEVALASQGPRY
ncbi:MAG: lytic transglycosylase domain-containing protein [Candidatus Omnitrophica bacterium]|nr:lytic transglycosylase domain-containing protein [Candidatus Omnitrophota bacterium]MCA9415856.1 lytic transglycosylase domain-containing protein [Candidatus Omnitrophota bacterium]